MRILVTGAAGFIGGNLIPALVGHEVTGTLLTKGANHPGVKLVYADLATELGWRWAIEASKPEVVFMAAGVTGGSGVKDPLTFVNDNVLMHVHGFRACLEAGVRRVIVLSSTTGYPNGPEPMREEDYFDGELHPAYFNPGHTRRFIERLGAMYPSLEVVYVRVAGVYGPGDNFDPQTSHVIPATVRKAVERQDPFVIWGDGSNVREALYIDDFVAGLVACIGWSPGAYNFGTGRGYTIDGIVRICCIHAGYTPRKSYDLTKPVQIGTRLLNCDKANALGWSPKVTMIDGLKKTVDWYASR